MTGLINWRILRRRRNENEAADLPKEGAFIDLCYGFGTYNRIKLKSADAEKNAKREKEQP